MSLPPEQGGIRKLNDVPHIRSIARDRRFECSTCGQSFRHLTHLSRHRKTHSNISAMVPCPICGKVFSRPDSMKRHCKNHTSDPLPTLSKRQEPPPPPDNEITSRNPTNNPTLLIPSVSRPVIVPRPSAQSESSSLTKTAPCPACGKIFPSVNSMLSHLMNDHIDDYPSSPVPPEHIANDEEVNERKKSIRGREKDVTQPLKHKNKKPECPVCGKNFCRMDMYAHVNKIHNGNVGSPASAPNLQTVESHLPQQPQSIQEDPVVYPAVIDGDNFEHQPENMSNILHQNWSSIFQRPIQDVYNFRRISPSVMTVNEALGVIFHRLRCRAKINLSFGFILRHLETGELRYFHPSQNNGRVFPSPETIASEADLNRLVERVREIDVLQMGFHRRPDTKWTVAATTNVTIYVNKLTQFPIGSPVQELPCYVANNKGLWNLVMNRNTGERIDDSLCFFRCLAIHRGGTPHSTEKVTHQLAETYRQHTGKCIVSA